MGATPRTIELQADMQIGRRQIRLRPIWPFDQAERIGASVGKVFVQARIKKFFRITESIKIKVI